MSFKRTAISLSILGFITFAPAFAEGENPKFEKAKVTAQAASDASDFKKAETGWIRCLTALQVGEDAPADANLELTLKRLAQATRQSGKYADSQGYLQRAIETANKINLSDPDLQTEANELGKFCRIIDPNKLGADAAKLITDNKAVIVVVKDKDKDEGNYIVTVTIPNKIENTTGDDTVDSIAMEKSVTLNLAESADGTVQATNIKGFKIHVVEKKMWVNLLGVNFGKPKETGERDAAITAGKMGVTKTVTQSVDAKTYQPVAAFIDETKLFGTPSDIATSGAGATSGSASGTSTSTSTTMTNATTTSTPAATSSTSSTTSAGDLNVPATTSSATSTPGPTSDATPSASAPSTNKTTDIDTTTVIDFSENSKKKE